MSKIKFIADHTRN